ncbi:hypothetical protein COBT_003804, partial [Conglomerata obtusa]
SKEFIIYWRNKHKPTCVAVRSFYSVTNLSLLVSTIEIVGNRIKSALDQNLPVILFIELWVRSVIIDAIEEYLKNPDNITLEGTKKNLKQFVFENTYGEEILIDNLIRVLNVIQDSIYNNTSKMDCKFINTKKCLYLTVVLTNPSYDIKHDEWYVEFMSLRYDKIFYEEQEFFKSIIHEFYKNYILTILNIFKSINSDICNLIMTDSENINTQDDVFTEEHIQKIFCFDKLEKPKQNQLKITKDNILKNQNAWYDQYVNCS